MEEQLKKYLAEVANNSCESLQNGAIVTKV